jgi:hypothetical protein
VPKTRTAVSEVNADAAPAGGATKPWIKEEARAYWLLKSPNSKVQRVPAVIKRIGKSRVTIRCVSINSPIRISRSVSVHPKSLEQRFGAVPELGE